MVSKVKNDLQGKRFGKLTAIKIDKIHDKYGAYWICNCDCGNSTVVSRNQLMNLSITSCGCQLEEYRKTLTEKVSEFIIEGTNVAYLKSNNISKNNKSGVRGVTQIKNGKWVAHIMFKRKRYNLGTYELKEDAIKARKDAEEKLHKGFLKEKGLID